MRRGVCDGCGMLGAVVYGVCAMCRVDGVPLRPSRAAEKAEIDAVVMCGAPDNFATIERERARSLAIRAEDPTGWAAAIGEHREPSPPRMSLREWIGRFT